MKERLAAVIADLRAAGVRVSVAEAIDAACAAAVVGVERAALADALAAAIVKDEGDRALFDECFARVFPAAPPRAATTAGARRRRAKGATSEGGGLHGRSDGDAGGAGAVAARDDDPDTDADGGAAAAADRESSMRSTARGANSRDDDNDRADHAVNSRDDEHDLADHAANSRHDDGDAADRRDGAAACSDDADPQRAVLGADRSRDVASESANAGAARAKAARIRALRTMAFVAMSPHDVEEASALVRVLAQRVSTRLRRRLRPQPRGRLDFRRTLRAATPRGGVPLERYFRGRRPRPPALVALCDLSASVATATDFFLALLAPAAAWFRDVRLYGFVDRLVEIEFAAGQIRPAAPLDLMARSDFGHVLADLMRDAASDLTRDTILLVLGDARNNRRPARADLLREARTRVRRLVWLNPEPTSRWNTGDSVIDVYARHADVAVPCGSLSELADALVAVARR